LKIFRPAVPQAVTAAGVHIRAIMVSSGQAGDNCGAVGSTVYMHHSIERTGPQHGRVTLCAVFVPLSASNNTALVSVASPKTRYQRPSFLGLTLQHEPLSISRGMNLSIVAGPFFISDQSFRMCIADTRPASPHLRLRRHLDDALRERSNASDDILPCPDCEANRMLVYPMR
jgi:hypothetical protein